jgi:hypothetical protein
LKACVAVNDRTVVRMSIETRPQGMMDRAREAVALWERFPHRQTPRPAVIIGPTILVKGAFTDGDSKRLFLSGPVTSSTGVPAAAIECLERQFPKNHGAAPETRPTLIRDATHVNFAFAGDRGDVILPAWALQMGGVVGRVVVLDDQQADVWAPSTPVPDTLQTRAPYPYFNRFADLSDSGRVIHLAFSGGPPSAVSFDTGIAVESDAAVAIVPIPTLADNQGRAFLLMDRGWTVSVTLTAPLGSRVLVDSRGRPTRVDT